MVINPLRDGYDLERVAESCAMVIFGASGDLTRRKLIPALYNLALEGLLPPGFTVIGYARRNMTSEEFRRDMKDAVQQYSRDNTIDEDAWERFAEGVYYVSGDFTNPSDYHNLQHEMVGLESRRRTGGNRIFYLATPPDAYSVIAEHLQHAGMVSHHENAPWTRLIIEKPFGHDLDSARELNESLRQVFNEQQIFRIDHYLGKETVQNILAFRFANGIFEPIWNRNFIDHVQITVAEEIGIENRGGYYDQSGAMRDMVQNHMLQLLSITAMEPPIAFEADTVRDEKVKALRAIRAIEPDEVDQFTVRGQYDRGWNAGLEVPGYREEPRVDPASVTETFIAMKLFIDNWRWAGVPFYLRSGKHMPRRVTEIAIQFRNAPHSPFAPESTQRLEPNVLAIRIQPDEGITLKMNAKVPGPQIRLRSVNMGFLYGTSFLVDSPDAYERLILDCMLGDSTLFTRSDETEAAWVPITQILKGWAHSDATEIPLYASGTWGPDEANQFIRCDGRDWRRP